MKTEGGRPCHSTGGVCLKDIVGLEGVELGANGKVRGLSSQSKTSSATFSNSGKNKMAINILQVFLGNNGF